MTPSEKVDRLSNAPIEKWPLQMLRAQVALLIPEVLPGFPFRDALKVSEAYTEAEARSYIAANMDLIAEKAT